MRALLDVNLLIALLDVDHVHHDRARDWLRGQAAQGWASCPITQNGCARIMSQQAYPNPVPTGAVIERLAVATLHPRHQFWPDDVSLLDASTADGKRILGPKQVTDVYLLALAVKHEGLFATFDEHIPLSVVQGATRKNVVVV